MRLAAVIFFVFGACIITLGAVWLNVLAPRMERLPTDFRWEEVLEGSYQVLNPATGQLDETAVTVRRTREIAGAEGDRAFIVERVTTTLSTGEPAPGFPFVETNLVVDRLTRLYLPGSQRYGGMVFPTDVRRGAVHSMWVEALQRALPARYDGSTELEGLEVYRFTVNVQDSELTADPESDLPRVGDVYIEYLVEPRSGHIVDTVSRSRISLLDPEKGKTPLFIGDVGFTDDTVARNLSSAKGARMKLILLGSYVPWLVMGLGMLFGLYGVLLYGVFRWKRTHAM